MAKSSQSDDDLDAAVGSVDWYHTIDLPSGPTPGEYDHRPSRHRVPIPPLNGKRCLDVGTHDGYWAFEMERLGAAEVVAIDIEEPETIDWPEPRPTIGPEVRSYLVERKRAFGIAHDALHSNVEHRYLSVYDLSPDLVGMFDFVFIGTLLHHLRDPVGALMAIRRVTRGQLCVCAAVSISKSIMYPSTPVAELLIVPGGPFWELPNRAAVRRQVESAGFRVIQIGWPFIEGYGQGPITETHRTFAGPLRSLPSRVVTRFGTPHVAVLAERQD